MIVTEYMENGSLDTFLRVSTQLHGGLECTTHFWLFRDITGNNCQ